MEDDSETGCAKDNGNLNDKDDAVGKNGDIESKCTRKNGNLNDAINEFSNVVRDKNQEGSPEVVDKDTDNLSAAYEELDIAANYWVVTRHYGQGQKKFIKISLLKDLVDELQKQWIPRNIMYF